MARKPLHRILSDEDVALLAELLRQGKTPEQIARHLKCSTSRVKKQVAQLERRTVGRPKRQRWQST